MKLIVKHFFDASHQLEDTPDLVSKGCARLHGHTYAVHVEVLGDPLRAGMVIDFKAIKQAIDVLDHQHINSVFLERGVKDQPTAENIARFIYREVEALGLTVDSIGVCEGYKGLERSSWVYYYGG
jgi:6-pyruvoyltetrahydropterin/6-carboxytetrahydropterin synthase